MMNKFKKSKCHCNVYWPYSLARRLETAVEVCTEIDHTVCLIILPDNPCLNVDILMYVAKEHLLPDILVGLSNLYFKNCPRYSKLHILCMLRSSPYVNTKRCPPNSATGNVVSDRQRRALQTKNSKIFLEITYHKPGNVEYQVPCLLLHVSIFKSHLHRSHEVSSLSQKTS